MIVPAYTTPPTETQAVELVSYALEDMRALTDADALTVWRCPRAGGRSRACFTSLRGPVPMRLRVVVTQVAPGRFQLRAGGWRPRGR